MDIDRIEEIQDDGITWSVSRLQTIFSCGRRYQFRYVDKVPEYPGPPLAFGSAIHRTIEALHWTQDWSDGNVQRLWSNNWYETSSVIDWEKTQYRKSTYDKKGEKILEAYIPKHKDDICLGVETDFRVFIEGGLPTLRGTFDKVQRLTAHEDVPPQYVGRLAVVDYKTSKNEPDALLLSVDPQLIIYAQAAWELLGENVVVGLHWLPGDKVFWKTPTSEDFKTIVVPMLKRGMARVENKEFERNVSWTCKFCPYKQECLGGLSESVQISGNIS